MERLLLRIIILFVICPHSLWAASPQPAQIRAPLLLYMVEFTQYPPDMMQTDNINMCFLESSDFTHADLLLRSKKKQIQQHPLNIVKLNSVAELQTTRCHLVFVSQTQESEPVFSALSSLNQEMLSIGETRDFVENGGMLAIFPGKSKMEIIINMEQLTLSPIKISSKVLQLATFY